MTSSLVGSEMCIRDRPFPVSCHNAKLTSDWMWPPATLCLPCMQSARHVPVSYTHLTLPTICSV
eukprot:4039095-Prorocentrum_lima.AAC.1